MRLGKRYEDRQQSQKDCYHNGNHYPIDTGRKLSVSHAFNLRPVSTG